MENLASFTPEMPPPPKDLLYANTFPRPSISKFMNNQPTLSTIWNQPGTWGSEELSQEQQKAIDTLLYNSFIAMAGWEAKDTSRRKDRTGEKPQQKLLLIPFL